MKFPKDHRFGESHVERAKSLKGSGEPQPRREIAWCEVKLRLAWCNYSPAGTLRGARWSCAESGATTAPQGECVVRGEIALSVLQLQPRRDNAWCEVKLRVAWCNYSPAGTLRGAK